MLCRVLNMHMTFVLSWLIFMSASCSEPVATTSFSLAVASAMPSTSPWSTRAASSFYESGWNSYIISTKLVVRIRIHNKNQLMLASNHNPMYYDTYSFEYAYAYMYNYSNSNGRWNNGIRAQNRQCTVGFWIMQRYKVPARIQMYSAEYSNAVHDVVNDKMIRQTRKIQSIFRSQKQCESIETDSPYAHR